MMKENGSFLSTQIKDIIKGGLPILFWKALYLFFIPFAIVAIMAMRILRPFVVIRLGPIISRRFGHFIGNVDLYLCEREAGVHGQRTFDVFYYYLPISNYQVKIMWERTGKLRISPFTRFTHMVDRVNRMVPGGKIHMIVTSDRDYYNLRGHAKPHLYFTEEEERLGKQMLHRLGIPDGNHFICFHARDSHYLRTVYTTYDWHYHDYRNSNIHDYIPAAKELAKRGYYSVRMGAIVNEPLNINHPKVIDYALNGRTDFLDVYLGAKCRFFICDTSGAFAAAAAFRRPIVWVNFIELAVIPTWGQENLLIPKKLWLIKERRLLTFREIMELGIFKLGTTQEYEQSGIEVIENTPEEITAVAIEMDERLKGVWQETEEDRELQHNFMILFKSTRLFGRIAVRIGAEFLRQNRHLLGDK